MIRVACSTTWQEIAGEYEYARNLIEYVHKVAPDIQMTPFPAPFNIDTLIRQVADYDVVFFNFCFGPHGNLMSPGQISKFGSKRVVLTFHENNPTDGRHTHSFLNECARVIVHENNAHGFIPIPHGIPVVEPCLWTGKDKSIGTAGFPFPDKRVPEIAQAARLLIDSRPHQFEGMKIVAAESCHADTFSVKRQVMQSIPNAIYYTEFMSQDLMLSVLSSNSVNVFTPNSRRLGPSGSVRLGLATGSHIVLNRSAMFRDLFAYEDEIEFVDGTSENTTPQLIAEACARVVENGKRPKRILEDGSWTKAAKLYADVFRSVV